MAGVSIRGGDRIKTSGPAELERNGAVFSGIRLSHCDCRPGLAFVCYVLLRYTSGPSIIGDPKMAGVSIRGGDRIKTSGPAELERKGL